MTGQELENFMLNNAESLSSYEQNDNMENPLVNEFDDYDEDSSNFSSENLVEEELGSLDEDHLRVVKNFRKKFPKVTKRATRKSLRKMIQNGGNLFQVGVPKGNPKFTAQFDVKIVRNSFNSVETFPIPIFGFYELENMYRDIIKLPTGAVSYVINGGHNSNVFAKAKIYELVFDIGGGLFETFTITCPQVPYPTLVQTTGRGKFMLNMVTMTLPNESFTAQFSEELEIFRRTMFGRTASDSFTPQTFVRPINNQKHISEIPVKTEMTEDKGLIVNVQSLTIGGIGISINLAMFVQNYQRR